MHGNEFMCVDGALFKVREKSNHYEDVTPVLLKHANHPTIVPYIYISMQ